LLDCTAGKEHRDEEQGRQPADLCPVSSRTRPVEGGIAPDIGGSNGLPSCERPTPEVGPLNPKMLARTGALNRQRRVVGDEPPADQDDLKDCHEAVEQLREEKKELEVENEQLRESADTFGELAERLNKKLKNDQEPE
jgi:hypothetical protein